MSAVILTSCGANNNIENNKGDNMKKAQVIIMLGQSNMEGHTHNEYLNNTVGNDKTLEYINGYSDVLINFKGLMGNNNSHNKFVKTKLGQGLDVTRFGPELGMAEYFHYHNEKLSDPVYLIKCAQGSTSLYKDWISPSSGKTGKLYEIAIEHIKSALEELEKHEYKPEIKAICFMQGEEDANSGEYMKYKKYEENFILDLRQEFAAYANSYGIGFVDAEINECHIYSHAKEINEAKKHVSLLDGLNICINTNNLDLKYDQEPTKEDPDLYHCDSSSMIKLGKLFAENCMQFLDLNHM